MSRLARKPLVIPKNVQLTQTAEIIALKGPKGEVKLDLNSAINVVVTDSNIMVSLKEGQTSKENLSMLGTTVIALKNKLQGVSNGFEKKLELFGVGYRAKVSNKILELTLGFSHPVQYNIPAGITIETPSNTEIIIKGIDKNAVGQVAADIRDYRVPECYKGKGVRYAGEVIKLKETKKK